MSQGAPETGDIPGAMHKPTTVEVKPESLEYAPTGGTKVWLFRPPVLIGRNFEPQSPIFTTRCTVREKRANIPMRYFKYHPREGFMGLI